MSQRAPDWLAGWQASFGALLRTPLDRSSGTLAARSELYDPALVETVAGDAQARARLAVYHRQYWFRLFGVMQQEFRLACALAGAWAWNGLVARFLVAVPPRGHDLSLAADGFAAWLATGSAPVPLPGGRTLPRQVLVRAATIDDAFRTVFWAPPPDPGAIEAFKRLPPDALASGRLRPSGGFVLVEEDAPLLELRNRLGADPVLHPVPVPPAHPAGPAHAAIHREPSGITVWPLVPAQARLYALLSQWPLATALAQWEAETPGADQLGRHVQDWLAASVARGFWVGVEPA